MGVSGAVHQAERAEGLQLHERQAKLAGVRLSCSSPPRQRDRRGAGTVRWHDPTKAAGSGSHFRGGPCELCSTIGAEQTSSGSIMQELSCRENAMGHSRELSRTSVPRQKQWVRCMAGGALWHSSAIWRETPIASGQ